STVSLTDIAAGSGTVGTVRYNGTTQSAGRFYGGTSNPTMTTRLNYDGHLYATNFVATSDIRTKKNLRPIENALDIITKITGYTYESRETGERDMGVVAQEFLGLLDEAVMGSEENGY